jgi:hypothetical protein
MPEKETLRANTAQILRNIQTFNERLKKRRERFGFISNNQEEIIQKEPQIEQIPGNPKRETKSFINPKGRGYGPNYT